MNRIIYKIISFHLLPAVILGALVFYLVRVNYQQELTKTASMEIAEVSDSVKQNILDNKIPELTQLIFDQKYNVGLDYIIVFDDKKQVLAHTFLDKLPAEAMLANADDDKTKNHRNYILSGVNILSVREPLFEQGYFVGSVDCAYNLDQMEKDYAATFYVLGAVVAFIILSLFISSYIVLINPIAKLNKTVDEIARGGNLDREIKIKSKDELGRLAASFMQLLGKLKGAQENLREQVTAKTKELTASLKAVSEQNKDLDATKTAMLNILEDERTLEAKLARDKSLYDAVVYSMGEGLLVTDKDFNIIMMNRAASAILREPPESSLGKDIRGFFHLYKDCKDEVCPLGSELPKMLDETVKTFNLLTLKQEDGYWAKNKKSRIFPISLVLAPLMSGGKVEGAVIVFRDVTEERKLESARVNFISLSSHQLRTPLTSIRWMSEMLLGGDLGKINKKQETMLADVNLSASNMAELINFLLQIARLESGRLRVEPAAVSLRDFTEGILRRLRPKLMEKSLKTSVKISPESLPALKIDVDIINNVVSNLLTNAIRYSKPKSAIEISIAKKGPFIHYSVADHGIGIPHSQQNRIFERFFRAENALKAAPNGSGLGLSLVKSLVESWGGKIWFKSEENAGSVFAFTLPLAGMVAKKGEVKLTV